MCGCFFSFVLELERYNINIQGILDLTVDLNLVQKFVFFAST